LSRNIVVNTKINIFRDKGKTLSGVCFKIYYVIGGNFFLLKNKEISDHKH